VRGEGVVVWGGCEGKTGGGEGLEVVRGGEGDGKWEVMVRVVVVRGRGWTWCW
jgi:hypothetical protein